MSKTRETIQQIEDVRKRRLHGSAMAELPLKLFNLENAFRLRDSSQNELIKYFPVALIACIEGYFRAAIKDLIDSGEPYLTNAEKPGAQMKFDFALLRAVHGKAVTVGELIAHSLPMSRLEHVDGALSSVMGIDFLRQMRIVVDRWSQEVFGAPNTPMLANPDKVFAEVARTFELRHIICHEIASGYQIKSEEISNCFESCVLFLKAADELISNTLHPNVPLTQFDMNVAAGEEYHKEKDKLDDYVKKIQNHLSENKDFDLLSEFNEAQVKWDIYSKSWADVFARINTGGTIWPLVHCSILTETTKHRQKELEIWLERDDLMS